MSNYQIKKDWLTVFKNALAGIFYAVKTQKNFKVYLALSLMVVFLGLWLGISRTEFLFLVLAIIFGLTIEMTNTAFEKTVDLVTEEYSEKARLAKDLAAGMMLVVCIGLAILGALILLPPLFKKFCF